MGKNYDDYDDKKKKLGKIHGNHLHPITTVSLKSE